jgi:hypothetical protein
VWLKDVRRAPVAHWAPLFILVPVVSGLALHVLTQIVRAGHGNGTPGWYLHIFAAPLALILALGWRRWLSPLLIYAVLFHVGCWALQLSLFSGCAFKGTAAKYVQLGPCFVDAGRLAALGAPVLGALALAAAVVAAGFALWTQRRGAPAAAR